MNVRTCGIEGCADIDGPAVVIDVLRAFTVAAWAFERGATDITLAPTVEEALAWKQELGAVAVNDGAPDGLFDMMNSPDEVSAADLHGRRVILRTQAGTHGAISARHAPVLFCTGFTTAAATVRALNGLGVDDVTMVATGTDDDVACADYMTALLLDGTADPRPFIKRAAESDVSRMLHTYIQLNQPGVGKRDVALSLEADRFDFAMRASDEAGRLVLRRVEPDRAEPT